MRTTVGPLPPSVYWRRRALVAGTVLIVVLLVAYSCGGSDEDGGQGATGNKTGTPNATRTTQGPPGPPAITPSAGEATGGAPVAGGNQNPSGTNRTAGAGGALCADSEVSVTAVAEPASLRQGTRSRFTILIRNISGRTCSRDIGAKMQELYVKEGETKQWSSDLCELRTNEAMQVFPPSHEVSFSLEWDGRVTSQGCDNRPFLAQGTYQLYARLGTKVSNPTQVVITAQT